MWCEAAMAAHGSQYFVYQLLSGQVTAVRYDFGDSLLTKLLTGFVFMLSMGQGTWKFSLLPMKMCDS